MRNAWAVPVTAALAAGLTLAPVAAWAQQPVDLGSSYVVDDTSSAALGSDVADLEQQVRDFYQEHDVQLFVVYVDTFTDPEDPQEWGSATVELSHLGDQDVLLSVAVEDRLYDFNASEATIPDAAYETITADYIRPRLAADDWTGAVEAALEGMAATLDGADEGSGDEEVSGGDSGEGGSDAGSPGSAIGWGVGIVVIVVLVLVVGIGIAIFVAARRRRTKAVAATAPAEPAVPIEQLDKRASSQLVQMDDDIRSSEQELGFAQAEFGDAAAEPFAQTIAAARADLSAAFALRQKLDDAEPDTDEQRRAWLEEIIGRCERARAALEQQEDAFDALRERQAKAPQLADRLDAELQTARASLTESAAAGERLRGRYAPEALRDVEPNLQQARERLDLAQSELTATREALSAGDAAKAVVHLQTAEASLGQGRDLAASVTRLGGDLDAAGAAIRTGVADLEADVTAARGHLATRREAEDSPLARAAAQAAAVVQQVSSAGGAIADPIGTLRAVTDANTAIDRALGEARTAQEHQRRAAAALQSSLLGARSEVTAADNFIASRRGAVGAEARTRLEEARRQLGAAEQAATADPEAAAQYARRASELARLAGELAHRDVNDWGSGGGGGRSGGGGDGFGDIAGGILGGLLAGGILDALGGDDDDDRGGWGGWGGGSGGGFRGGWGGSRSGRRSGGGGFGGGGRRSGGGGFGGGGRRGGGGRF